MADSMAIMGTQLLSIMLQILKMQPRPIRIVRAEGHFSFGDVCIFRTRYNCLDCSVAHQVGDAWTPRIHMNKTIVKFCCCSIGCLTSIEIRANRLEFVWYAVMVNKLHRWHQRFGCIFPCRRQSMQRDRTRTHPITFLDGSKFNFDLCWYCHRLCL